MIKRRFIIISVFFLFTSQFVSAAPPAWILLEQGKTFYEMRDLTAALNTLLDAVEGNNEYPEAEYWLGRVYEAQGQAVLAEEQYRRAIELALYLRVPEEKIEYRYSLASLLMAQGSSREVEAEAILHALADEEGASRPETIAKDHQYLGIVTTSGFDELLFLYRDELTWSLKARRMLGEKAWIDGRFRTSLLESTRVVLSLISTAAEGYREFEPAWRFDIDEIADSEQPDRDVRYSGVTDGTAALLDLIAAEMPEMEDWLQEEGFWSQLYLMASSLFAEGYEDAAVSVWLILVIEDEYDGTYSSRTEAGTWGRLAVRQLEEPFISRGSLSP